MDWSLLYDHVPNLVACTQKAKERTCLDNVWNLFLSCVAVGIHKGCQRNYWHIWWGIFIKWTFILLSYCYIFMYRDLNKHLNPVSFLCGLPEMASSSVSWPYDTELGLCGLLYLSLNFPLNIPIYLPLNCTIFKDVWRFFSVTIFVLVFHLHCFAPA